MIQASIRGLGATKNTRYSTRALHGFH